MGTRRRDRTEPRRTRRDLVNAPFGNILGGWYRFAAYEVRDGYVAPVPGAGYQVYDPWSHYRTRRRGEGGDCAHRTLLALADAADERPAAAETLVRAWCEKYGLFGLLPHRVHFLSLAARWEHPGAPIPKDQVWPVWRRYVHVSGQWVEDFEYPSGFQEAFEHPDRPPPGFPVTSARQAGRLVPRSRCGRGWGQPGVVLRVPLARQADDDLGIEVPEHQALAVTWGRYFPTIPVRERDTFAYPSPDNVRFWRLYAETVDEFLAAARQVRDACRALDQVGFPERPDDEGILQSMFLESRGLVRLHTLAAPTKLAVAFDPLISPVGPRLQPVAQDYYQQVWVSPSLLCSVAMMALLDRVGSPPTCKWCGMPITPGRSIGRYCSRRCYEAGKKSELRRARKGQPFPVIPDQPKRRSRHPPGPKPVQHARRV